MTTNWKPENKYKWLGVYIENEKYPFHFKNAQYDIDYLKNIVIVKYGGQTFQTTNIAIIRNFVAIQHPEGEINNETKPNK